MCTPVGSDGIASLAQESLTNVSDGDLTVREVTVDNPRIVVDDWFLAEESWPDAAVGSKRLPPPGRYRLPSTVPPGQDVLLVLRLRAPDLDRPRKMLVHAAYDSADGPGALTLAWTVWLAPAGETCLHVGPR